ncbi:hypothetical protein EYV94_25080 [Puteibacter caeruleilacunae]|nr:hypothetical protein EYV94_25080 [Puteibacter caeruleilacunae]
MYTVPIDLLLYSLRKRKVNQVRLYLYLKYMASGNIKLTNEVIDDICSKLHWCKKTFEKHRQWLLRKKWISYNNKTKSLHIKGYKKIVIKIKLDKQHNCGIGCSIEDVIKFRAFCVGAVISWGSRFLNCKKRASKCLKGDFNKDARHAKNEYELPNRFIGNNLELHYTTISKYRTLAEDEGYITIKQHYRKTIWEGVYLSEVKQAHPEIEERLKVRDGLVVEQLPSTIVSSVVIKRKRVYRPKKTVKKWGINNEEA